MKLNVKALALSLAMLTGLGVFILTWWIILFEGVSNDPTIVGLIYRGYTISPAGSVIGFAWGFVDGLIWGVLFGWLYNRFIGRGIKESATIR